MMRPFDQPLRSSHGGQFDIPRTAGAGRLNFLFHFQEGINKPALDGILVLYPFLQFMQSKQAIRIALTAMTIDHLAIISVNTGTARRTLNLQEYNNGCQASQTYH
jgi:hypothetical protein